MSFYDCFRRLNKMDHDSQQIKLSELLIEQAKYYMEFHHKCVSWYLTIFGFFIAAVVTSRSDFSNAKIFFWIITTGSTIIFGWFVYNIAHYSSRIHWIREQLENEKKDIPENWRKLMREPPAKLHGQGDWFFIGIMILMFGILLFLSYFKFM